PGFCPQRMKCTWESMRPGITVAPLRLIVWAQGPIARASHPTSATRPLRIDTAEATLFLSSIVRNLPLISARSGKPSHPFASELSAAAATSPRTVPLALPASTAPPVARAAPLMKSRREEPVRFGLSLAIANSFLKTTSKKLVTEVLNLQLPSASAGVDDLARL